MSYTWSSLKAPGGITIGTIVLMTDGSVLAKENQNPTWYRFFPDPVTGLYGTSGAKWSSTTYTMSTERRWFASGVLPDGRFFVFGSETGNLNNGEILDLSDPNPQWQQFAPPTGTPDFSFITGDVNACILADGRVLLGGDGGTNQTAIWDPLAFQGNASPPSEAWTIAGTGFGTNPGGASFKNSRPDEETWTLLTDGSVLTVDVNSGTNSAERYIPSTDQWISAGTTPSAMVWGSEMGPAAVLPLNGSCFCIGASGHTALYTLGAPNPWSAGPDTGPSNYTKTPGLQDSSIQTVADGPCCVLPNGKVLMCAGDPSLSGVYSFSTNARFYLYDPTTNTLPPLSEQPFPTPASSGAYTWECCLLVLPSGEVLLSNLSGAGSNMNLLTVSAPENAFQAAWQPTISNAPAIVLAGRSYTITGTQFNGMTSANAYGDDLGNASNYPIVTLTSTGSTSSVYYCRTSDFSSMAIATSTAGQTATVQIPDNVVAGQYSLRVIVNGIPSGPTLVEVVQQDIEFVMETETYSQGQVSAVFQNKNGAAAIIGPAFGIAVEGFTPIQLGFFSKADLGNSTTPPTTSPTIAVSPTKKGLTFVCYGPVLAEDISLPDSPQTFTYMYNAVFDTQADADAIFVNATETDYLIATFTANSVPLSAVAQVTFTQSPNPYMLHGDSAGTNDLSWVFSQDLRAFTILENENSIFGVTMGAKSATRTAADVATDYIRTVLGNLNGTTAADIATATSQFESLNDVGDDNVSLGQTDNGGTPIYNFCIARVRYQDVAAASNVRVFFRLWPGAQVATYNPNTLFRSYPPGNAGPTGYKVPLLGTATVGGDEIATVPFFATKRVNLGNPNASMTSQQADTPNLVANITASPETVKYLYFGAWLDINQPDEPMYPARLLGPSTATFPDGPYTGAQNIVPVLDLVRSAHQCLIAEISMDGIDIPIGATCGSDSHLAQRNLNFINVPNPGLAGSRRVSQPFEVRPTPQSFAAVQRPDEIMLQWSTDLPADSYVYVYMPVVQASDIIKLANEMYFTHKLSVVDANTISAPASGVTYIPLPARTPPSDETFVGLLSLDLPLGIRKGQEFGVIFKQLTNIFARYDTPTREETSQIKVKSERQDQTLLQAIQASDAVPPSTTSIVTMDGQVIGFQWRRVIGQFALQIPVSTKSALLPTEERLLSIFRYIDLSVDPGTRWYLVWKRYLSDIVGRVGDLGGDPGRILPDPNGGVTPKPVSNGEKKICGKIVQVCFDGCGCFKGFRMETERGEKNFECKEAGVGRLIGEVCERGWRVCVFYRGCEVLEIAIEKGARKGGCACACACAYEKRGGHKYKHECDHEYCGCEKCEAKHHEACASEELGGKLEC